MELVLSPGGFGPEGPADGGPFRNEDVREWSRVDRITGMLERARVETGRWRANTRDAAQSYGKMIDSRERNSADGSIVQKARRQVEIFQSQGTGGRSFQVVRASQWASSRATDVSIDVPLTKPMNGEYSAGALSSDSPSPRLSLWRAGLGDAASTASSDLETLSSLCRQLHDEALSRSRKMWSPSPSPPLLPLAAEAETGLADRRSNSSEDLASLVGVGDAFARDCKTRRSLQISGNERSAGEEERPRRTRNEFVAERARKFEEAAVKRNGETPKRNFISTKSFTSIADNDFVRNDPNHPSKIAQSLPKVSIQENAPNGHQAVQVSSTRRANNKTVVHLRNASSPVDGEPPRCINVVTAIKVEKDGESGPGENGHYGLPTDSPPREELAAGTTKPVKKVEFCKTEIHFAADSGKVNIVETDGKPPPTNKFRRRRRNNSLAAASNASAQKSNMPLVHFGDTSYEKYIFGGQGKPPLDDKTASSNNNQLAEENTKNYLLSELDRKDRWSSPIEKIREENPIPIKEVPIDPDKVAEQSKFKGAHTTTVNILSDEGNTAVSKVNEGPRGIQLQFASRSLSPLRDVGEEALVSRTTKITVHLQGHPAQCRPAARILLDSPLASLESVRLVMRLNEACARRRAASITLSRIISRLCEGEAGEAAGLPERLWALRLEDHGGTDQESERMLTDKASNAYPPASLMVHKEAVEAAPVEKLASKNQIISKDSDNNQVLLKIVTTHKPMLARVESDVRPSHSPLRSRSKSHTADEVQNLESDEIGVAPDSLDLAKDDCDKEIGAATADLDDDEEISPTYENIFDAMTDGAPVYENFQVVKGLPILPDPEDKVAPRKRLEKLSPVPFDSRKLKKVVNGAADEKPAKVKVERSKRPVTPTSGVKGEKSPQHAVNGVAEARRSASKVSSTRSGSSRDNSIRRYNRDAKSAKDEGNKLAQKRKTSKVEAPSQDVKIKPELGVEKNGTVRSKKPVEVVYQTAVYNMKNEKLSKPTKAKEVKGPRLINDLICGGSKMKRPSDGKKIVKTAIVSQNTSKRKETPTTTNR